ncbi:MAG: hypothetical protein BGO14_04350 [Chlamydiales bacterium 38-26]|nr:hypothetical protein [Chlamydiales bacterium]OJV07725.1 MAG: hypothetical protein BGO14_04350 [Chlamydiales bacterium 38-26]
MSVNLHTIDNKNPFLQNSFFRPQDKIAEGDQTEYIDAKRGLYNSAFKDLQALSIGQFSKDHEHLLYDLFYKYANKTCYAQMSNPEDEEEGFRKSARLMELSLCLQLQSLGLFTNSFPNDWTKAPNIESLIADQGIEKDSEGALFAYVVSLNTDPHVLYQKAQENYLKESLENTLRVLAYSYQNIESLRKTEYLALHVTLDSYLAAITGHSEADQDKFFDYQYNRCGFLQDLSGADLMKKMQAYAALIQHLNPENFQQYSFPKIAIISKIHNQLGLLNFRTIDKLDSDEEKKTKQIQCLEDFQKAFQIRSYLLENDCSKMEDHEYFLANIRTSLIHLLIKDVGLNRDSIIEHRQALLDFKAKLERTNNKHTYSTSYETAVQLATIALKSEAQNNI